MAGIGRGRGHRSSVRGDWRLNEGSRTGWASIAAGWMSSVNRSGRFTHWFRRRRTTTTYKDFERAVGREIPRELVQEVEREKMRR